MSIIRPKYNYCSTDPERILTLLEWIEETKKIKLVADPAFQANSVFDNDGRKGRWFTKHRRDYITNLVLNKAPSPFIIADNLLSFCFLYRHKTGLFNLCDIPSS